MNSSHDAMLDVYVPGAWRCPKCSFALQKATLFVQSGTIGSTVEDVMSVSGETCPNDGEPMLRETWHQRSEDNYKWGVGLMEEIIALTGAEHLPGAIEAIKRLRADALAPPEPQGWQPIETYQHPDGESIGNQVLVALEGDLVGEAYLNPKTGQWWWSGTMEGEYADSPIHSTVTHWMPFPAPPRADALEAPRTDKVNEDTDTRGGSL